MKQIIFSVLFGIGFLYSTYEVVREWKSRKGKTSEEGDSYKLKYFSLWMVVYAYLVWLQFVE